MSVSRDYTDFVQCRTLCRAHGDAHLLYCAWENQDSTLVSQAQFEQDMLDVYARMRKSGIDVSRSNLFIPPYEYYNEKISAWARGLGLRLVNFTPGTWTNADYTTLDMKNYRSSESIYDRVMEVEKRNGLNGHIMLFHLGTDDKRTDKFYERYLERLIRVLQRRIYIRRTSRSRGKIKTIRNFYKEFGSCEFRPIFAPEK